MKTFKLIVACLIFFSSFCYGQNRVFERPGLTGRSIFMDRGSGDTYIARERRFGWDSTHVHLLNANQDMELTHLGGFRLSSPLTWLNSAATVHDGVILGGANLGFSTWPYVLRMDTTGNVLYSFYFNNLTHGQKQIASTYVNGEDLDLFTWADNTRLSYYLLKGSIDGNFPSGLQVHAPEGIQLRTDDIATTENPHDYIVICQADTNNTLSRFLIVMRVNAEGVLWSFIHDHGTTMNFEQESAFGLKHLSDGNWMFNVSYRAEFTLDQRVVKIDGDGTVLWSKEYFLNEEKLSLGNFYETEDAGFLLLAAALSTSESLILKLDSEGEVLWSKVYVPSLTDIAPLGAFYRNDQNQIYSINNAVIAETDEEMNICDIEPHSGASSLDVTFEIIPVSHNTTEMIPEVLDMPFELRVDTLENSLSCLSTGIKHENGEDEISLYPNPAGDILNVDLSGFQGELNLTVLDMQGRIVHSQMALNQAVFVMDVSQMSQGMYVLHIESAHKKIRTQFVKE